MRATDKQVDFIIRLRAERELDTPTDTRLGRMLEDHADPDHEFDISLDLASKTIEFLLRQPMADGSTVADSWPTLDLGRLASGRYAVGDVLLKVDNLTGTDAGNWQGWVFVKNGSEYADEKFGSQSPGKTYRGRHGDLLQTVLDDPEKALAHYGHITGHCGVCGRKLEDEVSVARGIGPVCYGKLA